MERACSKLLQQYHSAWNQTRNLTKTRIKRKTNISLHQNRIKFSVSNAFKAHFYFHFSFFFRCSLRMSLIALCDRRASNLLRNVFRISGVVFKLWAGNNEKCWNSGDWGFFKSESTVLCTSSKTAVDICVNGQLLHFIWNKTFFFQIVGHLSLIVEKMCFLLFANGAYWIWVWNKEKTRIVQRQSSHLEMVLKLLCLDSSEEKMRWLVLGSCSVSKYW